MEGKNVEMRPKNLLFSLSALNENVRKAKAANEEQASLATPSNFWSVAGGR